tara:strand:- start:62 stop:376 length:315 start_codon:yes stop_codon:yes gene_type:complete
MIKESKITLNELHKSYPYLDEMKAYYQEYERADKKQQNKMDNDGCEYLPHTAYLVEIFNLLGNKLKPKNNCSSCDIFNDYICFDCEINQINDSNWEIKLAEESE